MCGVSLLLADQSLSADRTLAYVGFGFILVTAILQLLLLDSKWIKIEEALALPAILIIGLGEGRVTVLSLLWLAAVAAGVLARGGRVHWVGRTVVLLSLILPIAIEQRLTLSHAALCIATIALLLTCGRVTQELQFLLARARFDADHDHLTGAFSRAKFRDLLDGRAGQATAETGDVLLLVDLDNFGQINKTAGHAAGDRLLTRLGELFAERAGSQGIVGRLGGDEFGLAVCASEPEIVARELIQELATGEPPVPASIGIARAPADGHTADSLLRAADIALRVAKRAGRQQVSAYVGDSLSDEGPGGARAALSRLIEGEDLSIFVQPIVDLDSGRVHAFEALARFETGSTSSPLHWFALSEEFGMRPELELACLRAALELLDELPGRSRLSVNLSGSLLLDERTFGLLLQTPDVSRLIIELTENTLVEETPELHAAIAGLRNRGAHLAIDDMGAGYSGLKQITSVQARYLKLDRSLVTGIQASPERQALIAALLGYAERMGGALVAEGVETDEELEAIQDLGVPLVQGYLLGRPSPPWPQHADADMLSERGRARD